MKHEINLYTCDTPAHLVSQFVVDTAKKIMEVVQSASVGALLVYECYNLVKGRNDFEKEEFILIICREKKLFKIKNWFPPSAVGLSSRTFDFKHTFSSCIILHLINQAHPNS